MKRALAPLVLVGAMLVIAGPVPAAQQFGPRNVVTAGWAQSPSSVEARDLDGDGDADVLSAGGENAIYWWANVDGKGTLGPRKTIATLQSPVSVHAADLDGDLDLDVVAGSGNLGGVAWYENLDGQGSFGVAQPVTSFGGEVRTADLDGDGDLDLLWSSSSSNRLAWYENLDGAGTFGPEQLIALGTAYIAAVAEDLDGDGDRDVLVAGVGVVSWFENTGAGSFRPEQVISTAVATVLDVVAADLDGDGDLDVASASTGDDKVAWYENVDGFATFGPQEVVATGINSAGSVAAADLDGDADLDLVATSLATVVWFENGGGGTFGSQPPIDATAPNAGHASAADMDGDGDLDVIAAVGGKLEIAWYRNTDGLGAFAKYQTTSAAGASAVAAADVDGDGRTDLLSASSNDGKLAWYRNQLGTSPGFASQPITFGLDGALGLGTADLDGDGDLDALGLSETTLAWVENQDGAGGFGGMQALGSLSLAGFFGAGFASGDLDGDGDVDVLRGTVGWEFDPGALSLHRNEGPGSSFTETLLSLDGAGSLALADVDADGDLDVVAGQPTNDREKDDRVAWYENLDGLGTLGPATVLATGIVEPSVVLSADLDGDGSPDVLAASAPDDKAVWYRNTDGLGTFGAEQPITNAADSPRSLFAADLDGDGDLDVASASSGGSEVAWHVNTDGLGSFGSQEIVTTAALAPRSVIAADLDGDGYSELATASFNDSAVAWHENLGCSASVAAAAVVRLGSPPNPAAFLPGVSSGPVLGATWNPVVDHASFAPAAVFDVMAVSLAPANVPLAIGTLLCDLTGPLVVLSTSPGAPFALPVPTGCALAGATLCAQGGSVEPGGIVLANALDLTLGTF